MRDLQSLGSVKDAVVPGHRIVCTGQRTLCADAIISIDINDQSIVEFSLVLNLLNHSANFMIGIGGVSCEYFRLPRIEFLLSCSRLIEALSGDPVTFLLLCVGLRLARLTMKPMHTVYRVAIQQAI